MSQLKNYLAQLEEKVKAGYDVQILDMSYSTIPRSEWEKVAEKSILKSDRDYVNHQWNILIISERETVLEKYKALVNNVLGNKYGFKFLSVEQIAEIMKLPTKETYVFLRECAKYGFTHREMGDWLVQYTR